MGGSSGKTWWYAAGQEKIGPYSGSELKRLAQSGTIAPDTLIWREGMANWTRASKFTKLWEHATQPMNMPAAPPLPARWPGEEKPGAEQAQAASFGGMGGGGDRRRSDELHDHAATDRPYAARADREEGEEETGFFWAIKRCYGKYFSFSGRARRSEYWWFFLFGLLIYSALAFCLASIGFFIASSVTSQAEGMAAMMKLKGISKIFDLISLFVVGIPMLSAGARRLHDIGRTGWWQLLWWTVIGGLLLLFWHAQVGDEGRNEYGPDPIR